MGGNAFTQPGPNDQPALVTPRLTPQQYDLLKTYVSDKLAALFECLAVPKEMPGKESFGDLDYLAVAPTVNCPEDWVAEVQSRLSAPQVRGQDPTASFAVPWDIAGIKDVIEQPRATNGEPQATNDVNHEDVSTPTHHAQIDLSLIPPSTYPWQLFLHSHGDLSRILAHLLRPLALHLNHHGLHLRLAEIAASVPDKKKSLLFLSTAPDALFRFLEIDYAAVGGAGSCTEMFDQVVASPFFGAGVVEWAATPREDGTRSDRQRHAKRPMYRQFMEEYIPANLSKFSSKAGYSREEVRERAVRWFGKEAELATMLGEWAVEEAEKAWWADVVGVFPGEMSVEKRRRVVRGLKRWVEVGGGEAVVRREARALEGRWVDGMGVGREGWGGRREGVLEWVKGNWEMVNALEKGRVKGGGKKWVE
ncbi:hypothetical protein P152DRAFT_501871 [Eremomyces bilateralis CBS 781.70]|uniref:Uncharacterized protein n=1 Tax=Eremomyces bilateralis CBS 781.70 TaxID=1392243 RepID=A0A6G1G7N0_9PEZI|nr:uncharacterized protein P152DRAFT_501871 [Eremomyces bilateralis CBS 781.70]KAF1814034.1 hypothetical protein P152DRAFT_501871 [Eremomyces bilateralis CBS 781.70]